MDSLTVFPCEIFQMTAFAGDALESSSSLTACSLLNTVVRKYNFFCNGAVGQIFVLTVNDCNWYCKKKSTYCWTLSELVVRLLQADYIILLSFKVFFAVIKMILQVHTAHPKKGHITTYNHSIG